MDEPDVGDDVQPAVDEDLPPDAVAAYAAPTIAPTEEDVEQAAERLSRWLQPTPVHFAERLGCWLKLENLQRTGSYKVRGALNALLAARELGDHMPVVAASAGNHAQGVAWAARELGVRAICVMPESAPETKVQGVRRLGAEVVLHGPDFDTAQRHARKLAASHNYYFLSPFDDVDVIAGQGTVGTELLAQRPDVVVVPIGGGGLAAGVVLALKRRGVRIVGAQVVGVDAMHRVLNGAAPTPPVQTLADGIRVYEPGYLTRAVLANQLDDLVIVTEREMHDALRRLVLEERIVAEGAGALAVAALAKVSGKRRFAVVSGGNIDAAALSKVLSSARPRAAVRRKHPAPVPVFV